MKKTNKKFDMTKLIIILAIVVGISMVVKGIGRQPIIAVNNEKAEEIKAEIEQEKQRIAELDETMKNAGTDEYIEKIAREKLGMIKANEIVFIDVSGQE